MSNLLSIKNKDMQGGECRPLKGRKIKNSLHWWKFSLMNQGIEGISR